MRKIKIAQIGINKHSHATQIFATLKALPDVFEIAGYALVEGEREECKQKLSVFDGYKELTLEEILNDESIEAVTVETDEIHLTKYATLAAKHGKHIHMEKPGGESLPEFERLIETVKKSGKTFSTGYMYRYNPCIKEILSDIKSGKFGEVHSVEASMNCIHPDEARKWLGTLKGGMMFYLGCHLIDLAVLLRGLPKSVKTFNRRTMRSGIDSIDYGMAVFEYDNGCSIIKTDASEIGGYARRALVVTGSKKTVELKPLEMSFKDGPFLHNLYTDRVTYESTDWFDRGVSERFEYDRYFDLLKSFAAMVRGEIENPFTPDYELELYKLILKCCE